MDKVKELLKMEDCHILSIEDQKALKGGLFLCDCGDGPGKYVETIEECLAWCEKMQ